MTNDTWTFVVRRPVKREGSVQYMVFVLVSFAISVSLTRFFLSVSGYPQIATGDLHIAHVLWGGLLLFIAALLPLLMSNRRAYKASAILSGVGIGLFIDEVGKYITQRNDYFYPAAAPIIYIFFMLTLLLLMQLRRQSETTSRAELCRALETLQDWIYHPLDRKEASVLVERLGAIKASADSEVLANLASGILDVIRNDPRPAPTERPPRFELYIKSLDKWLSEQGLRVALAIGLFITAVIALKNPVGLLIEPVNIHGGRWYTADLAPTAFQVRVILEILVGVLLFVDSILLLRKQTRVGVPLGFGLLLVYFGIIDMLLFYFEQFSTITFVLYQFVLLTGLIYYRTRFSQPDNLLV